MQVLTSTSEGSMGGGERKQKDGHSRKEAAQRDVGGRLKAERPLKIGFLYSTCLYLFFMADKICLEMLRNYFDPFHTVFAFNVFHTVFSLGLRSLIETTGWM